MIAQEILFVAANPSIDRLYELERLTPGAIHRPRLVLSVAGGKGLNAARVAASLGAGVTAVGLLGGYAGTWIQDELARTPVRARWLRVDAETRTCISILDRSTGKMTEVYENGATIQFGTWDAFQALVESELSRPEVGAIAISGSLPPGAPADGYARIVMAAGRRSVTVFADTHGDPLVHVLEIGVGFVKINAAEAEEVSGHAVANVDQATVAGRVILQRARASRVIVTLGALGAVLVTREGALHASLPMASAGPYTVGSGDAFLGGLATGIMEGASADDAVRLASAAAVANTMVPGSGELDASAARRLARSVSLVEV